MITPFEDVYHGLRWCYWLCRHLANSPPLLRSRPLDTAQRLEHWQWIQECCQRSLADPVLGEGLRRRITARMLDEQNRLSTRLGADHVERCEDVELGYPSDRTLYKLTWG